MNFGSEYVFMYNSSDSEDIDDLALENGDLSDEESSPTPERKFKGFNFLSGRGGRKKQSNRVRKYRKADTNVISVDFKKIVAPNYMHTGDAIKCESCTAIINKSSPLENIVDSDEKKWKCEFCSNENMLNIDEEEIPKDTDVTYMIQPAPATKAITADGDNSIVLFCIDTSGSMIQSKQVPGKFKFKGRHDCGFDGFIEGPARDQFLPGEKRNMTWISRLQAVQAAVDAQLKNLIEKHPSRKVGLVVFNNDVTLFGDNPENNLHISGDKLSDFDTLLEIGKDFQLPGPVQEKGESLSKSVFDLEATGKTALGPALIASIGLASKAPASKIILCTDGKANVGLGNLEDNESLETAPEFYQKACNIAKENGTSISVITIDGTDCSLHEIGKLAQETEGSVDRVDPMTLAEEFGNILEDQIIATKVKATLLLHEGLYFRDEANKNSRIEKTVGNVTKDTEITFEYGVKPGTLQEIKTKKNKSLKLPFQLQIEYTDIEGARALRVITESKPITAEREEAEKKMSWSLLGKHAPKKTAKLALGSRKESAVEGQLSNISYTRMMSRNKLSNLPKYKEFKSVSEPLYAACKQSSETKGKRDDASSNVLYQAAMSKFGKIFKKKDAKTDSDEDKN